MAQTELPRRVLTRKQFLDLTTRLSLGAGAALLAACSPAPPAGPAQVAPPTAGTVPPPQVTPAQGTAAAGGSEAPAGTLTVVTGFDPNSLNPFVIQGVASMGRTLYDQLVVRDASMKIVPALATSWEYLNDTTVQFKLRQGISFHNGEPFNAAAVKWSFEQFVNPETKNPYANLLARVKTVEIVDDYTVRVGTDGPFPSLIENLAYGFMIGPPQAMQAQGADFLKQQVGTGPFKFVSWRPGEKLVVEAAGAHWNGAAKVKSVVFQPMTEAASRVTALRAGQADLINNVAPTDLPSITNQPGITVAKLPATGFLV